MIKYLSILTEITKPAEFSHPEDFVIYKTSFVKNKEIPDAKPIRNILLYRMKKTTSISIILLTGVLLFNSGCKKEEKELFCVTYHVSAFTILPCKLLISYQDSGRTETFYCSENEWSKKVCLPPHSIASLVVEPVFDPKNGFFYPFPYSGEEEDAREPTLVISISHPKKKIFKTNGRNPKGKIYLSLLRSETE